MWISVSVTPLADAVNGSRGSVDSVVAEVVSEESSVAPTVVVGATVVAVAVVVV